MNDKDLKMLTLIEAHNEIVAWLMRCQNERIALSGNDRAPEPARTYWQQQQAVFEITLAETVKALNVSEIAKMQDMTVQIISTSPKRGTMQVVLKDKENGFSVTRHLRYQFGGWQGHSLLKRQIINFSTSGIIDPARDRKTA